MVTAKHISKKEEILAAGMEVLWRNGYNGTSVKDIVDAAGIPKGSFYQYFESKEDFAKAAMNSACEYAHCMTKPVLTDVNLSPVGKVRKLYEMRIHMATEEFHYEKGCMLTNLTGEVANSNESLRKITAQTWKKMIQPLVDTLQDGIDQGEINGSHNASELAEYIENAFRGAITSSLASRSPASYDSFLKYTFENILI
jgi:TetR/AcrR family transcriptional repressor of nem operon